MNGNGRTAIYNSGQANRIPKWLTDVIIGILLLTVGGTAAMVIRHETTNAAHDVEIKAIKDGIGELKGAISHIDSKVDRLIEKANANGR